MAPENLKKQLALAVRTIQWSYGIFWSISDRQPGVLEWGDGYYNGDIKTRKTVQSVEFNTDQMDFQRSEKLKELYESLATGEANPQARGPSAALSPEDLTDLEWYYLVCMSFVFNIGQGLPGRTLASSQPIWLRNAHYAGSKVFSRSLLAKSVSIKTVVCFPYLGGVIELGITEMVMEDPSLIQLVKKTYLDSPYPMSSEKPDLKDLSCSGLDHDNFQGQLVTVVGCEEELKTVSPNNSSSDSEGINGAPQVQSLQVTEDEFCDSVHNSMNFSDCISQTCIELNKVVSEDLYFQSVLSTLFKSSHQLVLGHHFGNSNKESSFVSWKRVGSRSDQKPSGKYSQKLLKKVLLGICTEPETDEIGLSKKKEENLDQRFFILRSLVPSIPSISKVDKVSILDNTIEYLRELEKRVTELEPCRRKRKPCDTAERTSDNYDCNKPGSTKRKASEVESVEPEITYDSSSDNLSISVSDEDVLIELRCPWKEGGLLEVMVAVSSLCLDSHSVESITRDGVLYVTIRAKVKGSTRASARMIRQALSRFAGK